MTNQLSQNNMYVIQTQYVLGFMFSPDLSKVVLIRKNKPEFQAGKLNGVGGKIEDGETADDAMRREFKEEAGLDVDYWQAFGSISGLGFDLHLYFCPSHNYDLVKSITAEQVQVYDTNKIITNTIEVPIMGNVPWLVTMAKQIAIGAEHISTFKIEELPTWRWTSGPTLGYDEWVKQGLVINNGK